MKTLSKILKKQVRISIAGFLFALVFNYMNFNQLYARDVPVIDTTKRTDSSKKYIQDRDVIRTELKEDTSKGGGGKYKYTVIDAHLENDTLHKAGLDDKIEIEVDNLDTLLKDAKYTEIIPFIDGKPLNGVISIYSHKLVFVLNGADSSRESWERLLSKPSFFTGSKEVSISVGFKDGPGPIPTKVNRFSLSIYKVWELWLFFIITGLVLFVLVFIWLGYHEGMLRDPTQFYTENKKDVKYSLALTQMAVWFFLVVMSYILIYLITREFPKIPESVLILIGISTFATIGSSSINVFQNPERAIRKLKAEKETLDERVNTLSMEINRKPENKDFVFLKSGSIINGTIIYNVPNESVKIKTKNENIVAFGYNEIEKITKEDITEEPANKREIQNDIDTKQTRINGIIDEISKYKEQQVLSKSSGHFWEDLLKDSSGYSLYRLQNAVFTLLFGATFIIKIWENVAMPDFDTSVLVLMGISSGTYVGFKILPEEKKS